MPTRLRVTGRIQIGGRLQVTGLGEGKGVVVALTFGRGNRSREQPLENAPISSSVYRWMATRRFVIFAMSAVHDFVSSVKFGNRKFRVLDADPAPELRWAWWSNGDGPPDNGQGPVSKCEVLGTGCVGTDSHSCAACQYVTVAQVQFLAVCFAIGYFWRLSVGPFSVGLFTCIYDYQRGILLINVLLSHSHSYKSPNGHCVSPRLPIDQNATRRDGRDW